MLSGRKGLKMTGLSELILVIPRIVETGVVRYQPAEKYHMLFHQSDIQLLFKIHIL